MHADNPATRLTRLAPSPTGALHLGNLRTFLVTWAIARQNNWHIVMRIEDLDGPRIKPDAERLALDTLSWIGIDWDSDVARQSDDLAPYTRAMERLAARAMAYPCELTRTEIADAASAPHAPDAAGEHETPFPTHLRPPIEPRSFADAATNWRFVVPDEQIVFVDDFVGPQHLNPAHSIGDFVIWTKRAQPAYQLAVIVDDARQGVTDVIRGDDLLDSTARQLLLYRALDLRPPAHWMHLPLVVGPDGKRLAKRHGDTRVAHYRQHNVAPQRIIGLLAHWCGITPAPKPMSAKEFLERFDCSTIPRSRIVMRPEDDAWLFR
ncbi:MAG: hypothetical protein KDA20_12940 [Phycisphaerales bacterium]|nr:hypothetical protein [Phycisphaerales bacterium]